MIQSIKRTISILAVSILISTSAASAAHSSTIQKMAPPDCNAFFLQYKGNTLTTAMFSIVGVDASRWLTTYEVVEMAWENNSTTPRPSTLDPIPTDSTPESSIRATKIASLSRLPFEIMWEEE
ncbi:hypothetical protein [Brevibacterium litoralis]|uniref:hypothetical protein n=1 Tax=Brevibacterium litoralis TaxID=3138935 RepID=UPI0032EF0BBB